MENGMKIKFMGAARHVTGSCFCLEAGGLHIMVDCGLYQERDYLAKNWEMCPGIKSLDYLILTHAHLDHSGRIPRLVKMGFNAPILTTPASAELAKIVLLDSARLQEEDASFKAKRHAKEGRKVDHPVVPLYTVEDAEQSLPLFESRPYGELVQLNDHVSVRFHDAGHILGSSMVEINVNGNGQSRRFIFSGDIGQWDKPIIRDPSLFDQADYVIMESTYGDRDHEEEGDVRDELARVINETVERGGNIVVPTFAIERAQEIMYHLSALVHEKRIPHLMVFLDSPMAVDVTDVFLHHRECLDEDALALFESDEPPFRFPGLSLVRKVQESKAINRIKGSCVIMAGSGMCTGGRVKHHLVENISNPKATILFVGFQANGTLGRQISEGSKEVRILGTRYPVRARIEQIHGFSAHADRTALLRWVGNLKSAPERVFVVHGEEDVALKFAKELEEKKGWKTAVPKGNEEYTL